GRAFSTSTAPHSAIFVSILPNLVRRGGRARTRLFSSGDMTMRYMMFIKHAESYRGDTPPQALYDAMGVFVGDSMKNGSIIDTAGLKPTADGTRVRLSGGKIKVSDGPFTEAKEIVGGYALVEAKSKQEAIDLATRFMDLHRVHWPAFEGECEVRPLEDMGETPPA